MLSLVSSVCLRNNSLKNWSLNGVHLIPSTSYVLSVELAGSLRGGGVGEGGVGGVG